MEGAASIRNITEYQISTEMTPMKHSPNVNSLVYIEQMYRISKWPDIHRISGIDDMPDTKY